MNNVQRSQAFLRKRKMMLVFPLLVTPFLTMAFWAMGGGKGSANKIEHTRQQGLNLQLPNANLKDDKMADKMSFYDQADKDSIKLAEEMRNDPYFRNQDSMQKVYENQLEQITQNSAGKFNQSGILQHTGLKTSPYDRTNSPAEERVMKKLAQLNDAINQPEQNPLKDEIMRSLRDTGGYNFGNDMNRLENMMKTMTNDGTENDPEIKQLDNTLDKILDIQHPERVKERIREKSTKNKTMVFPVSKEPKIENISLLDGKKKTASESGFFGLNDQASFDDNNSVEAVVHENQTLVNGSVIKLRLLTDIYINGSLIPKGNFVFGIASLNGERLEAVINSIRYNNSLYPVKLEVYDMDGLAGIYIPGAITRDVAKQSVDNNLQLMELSTMDPSLKAQAAAAGIGATKSLLSKKVKQIKVVVKAGYRILLKDKNIEQ
jgi:conjugative transposon TraM protein